MAHSHPTVSRTDWLDVFYARAIAVPAVLFPLAMISDWTYARAQWLLWSNFSDWLLLGGLMGGVVAWLALALSRRDGGGAGWVGLGVLGLALAVEIVNFMIHMRDGYTTVVPTGLLLSILGAALLLAAAWLTRRIVPGARP